MALALSLALAPALVVVAVDNRLVAVVDSRSVVAHMECTVVVAVGRMEHMVAVVVDHMGHMVVVVRMARMVVARLVVVHTE